jgi:hypothetical protein
MTLDPGTGQFIVRGNISVPYPGSLSAGKSVIADHLLGFRTGTVGGSVGSWEVDTGRAAGSATTPPPRPSSGARWTLTPAI